MIVDWAGDLLEGDFKTQEIKKLGQGFKGGDGLAVKDKTIFISSWIEGAVYSFKNGKTMLLADGFGSSCRYRVSL